MICCLLCNIIIESGGHPLVPRVPLWGSFGSREPAWAASRSHLYFRTAAARGSFGTSYSDDEVAGVPQTLTKRRLSVTEDLIWLHHLSEGEREPIPSCTAGDSSSDPAQPGTSVPCYRQVPTPVRAVAGILPRWEPQRQ